MYVCIYVIYCFNPRKHSNVSMSVEHLSLDLSHTKDNILHLSIYKMLLSMYLLSNINTYSSIYPYKNLSLPIYMRLKRHLLCLE